MEEKFAFPASVLKIHEQRVVQLVLNQSKVANDANVCIETAADFENDSLAVRTGTHSLCWTREIKLVASDVY